MERLLQELKRWGKFAKDKLAKRSCTNLCELKVVPEKILELSYANLKSDIRNGSASAGIFFANLQKLKDSKICKSAVYDQYNT